jgi:leucyl-tRNA synthetase
MDPHNDKAFCDRKVSDYWGQVDLYIGGTEHAVGHLLYSRMWTKALYDLGYIGHDEPYKRLVNQGMITGKSFFADGAVFINRDNRVKNELLIYLYSFQSQKQFPQQIQKDGKVWEKDEERYEGGFRLRNAHKYIDAQGRLTESMFNLYRKEEFNLSPVFENQVEVDWAQEEKTETGEPYLSGVVIEKMSKSKFNVDSPDEIVDKYGADTFRMYEMFLGPVEMSKPWDTKGIEGVHRFLKKLWRLFFDDMKGKVWKDETPTDAEMKVLHKTIKQIEEATERFSFNTGVSGFMIAVNELTDLKCHKKAILEKILILLTPYAPHVAEELWGLLGNTTSILDAEYPKFEEKYVKESSKAYPVAINGKTRTELTIALDATQQQVEEMVLADEIVKKWLNGNPPKKIIYVKNKMINVVI